MRTGTSITGRSRRHRDADVFQRLGRNVAQRIGLHRAHVDVRDRVMILRIDDWQKAAGFPVGGAGIAIAELA
jgi:hypothetical protein